MLDNSLNEEIDLNLDEIKILDDNYMKSNYEYDINGNRELIENTEIKLDSLPQSVQEEIQKGVVVDTQDEAYSRLESFGS